MKFRHLILLIVLTAMGFVLQQFVRYFTVWDELQAEHNAIAPLAAKIENVMYEEKSIRQQLAEAERQHAKLRRLLPETLAEEELEQQIAALAQSHGIKILATKTAINSRPNYHMATFNMTLEANDIAAKRFMRELKSIPRRIHVVPPEKRGKKSIHLSISVYAVEPLAHETYTLPQCIEMPTGIVLPPLQEQLTLLYADYIKQCHFIARYNGLYLEQLRQLALQQENARLQALERQLRRRP